MNSFSEVW